MVRLIEGDCLVAMREMAKRGETVHAVVCDPPYELGFMGKRWDNTGVAFQVETWRLAWDLLPPGGHLVAFGGTRTFHRMAVAIEDAGFELRDTLMWLYGTGFPKSYDVSKGIEAKLLTGGCGPKNLRQRDMGDAYRPHDLAGTEGYGDGRMSRGADTDRDYKNAPPVTTPEAAEWTGWGTALKPAWEPIILARKPLAGTVAANVLAHRTGALNVDGCRIGDEVRVAAYTSLAPCHGNALGAAGTAEARRGTQGAPKTYTGRWPANVLHDGSDEVEAAFAAFGERPGQLGKASSNPDSPRTRKVYGALGRSDEPMAPRGDTGSASRFFYSAKASAADRAGSKHPTVKPVALMRWLVRLVCPPGGVVLDPSAGSGTTGAAAVAEGMAAVLIEREAEYQADIRRRLGLRDKAEALAAALL